MNSEEKLVVRTKKNDTLGNFIQECRQRYGWTQEELGWRTGITREHVGRIERGKCVPSVQTLYDLEKALNLPECSLVRRVWCCTIKVDIENSKSQYIEKDKQEAMKDGSESTKI